MDRGCFVFRLSRWCLPVFCVMGMKFHPTREESTTGLSSAVHPLPSQARALRAFAFGREKTPGVQTRTCRFSVFSRRTFVFRFNENPCRGRVWVVGRVRVDSVGQAMNGGLKRTPSWARISSYEHLQVTHGQARARASD